MAQAEKTIDYKKRIAALYRINKFLEYIDDLDSLLNSIMEEASSTVNAQASSIALYEPENKELIFTIALGEKGEKIKQMRLKLGQGIIGHVAFVRKPLNIADVTKDKRFYSGADEKTDFKTKSILAVPIIHKEKLVGALEVINKKDASSFLDSDVELLEIVAGQAAVAIENARLYKKTLAMERMSAIGDMASRMVHDLRNPLTIVKNCAFLLKMPEATEEEKKNLPKVIIDEIDRLTGMTTEVMEFVKGKSSVLFAEFSMGIFIDEVSAYLTRDFQNRNIQLLTKPNYTGTVNMDKAKMQRAIFNLAFNARDAMPNGGAFQIETNLTSDNEHVEIRLSDTGGGIPAEIKDKLFTPLVTAGKAHGTGLGLAIVKKIITEIHAGTITVESHPPAAEGSFNTTFIITIPLKRQAEPPK